ncbi:hypothetical protein ACFVYA_13560 [Amycolatopsis sp. NPDC058278]|uniref:hypothetical protein n=1 Tax=Amycolatopsis sp. NPDC058278 TaxID=3346417 RepID=UPI0036DF804A
MDALAHSPNNVAAMLGEFENAIRQWRYDGDGAGAAMWLNASRSDLCPPPHDRGKYPQL